MLGGGSWATALTKILSENGSRVYWWMRSKDDVQHLLRTRHNPRYLSSVAHDLDARAAHHRPERGRGRRRLAGAGRTRRLRAE